MTLSVRTKQILACALASSPLVYFGSEYVRKRKNVHDVNKVREEFTLAEAQEAKRALDSLQQPAKPVTNYQTKK